MIDQTAIMVPNTVNEFLPAAGAAPGHRLNPEEGEEDDFDVARFSAIRKEQKEQLERLEQHYQHRQTAIEQQVRAEQEGLFNVFQQGMQNLYTGLTQHVTTTIEAQVKLRMEQERLREEHSSQKRDIERRYHNEASRLVMSTSHATRNPKQLPRSSSSASHSNSFPGPNGEQHHHSPRASSVMQTPPVQHQTVVRPMSNEHVPRDFVLQEPPRREYLAPYPTPQEPVPNQRKPVPSEPRAVQPQPQPVKPQPVPGRQLHEEPLPIQPQQPPLVLSSNTQQPRRFPEASTLPSSRPEIKRKALESPPVDDMINGANSKRPRTRDRLVEEIQPDPYESVLKRSPRPRRSSQLASDARIERTIPFEEIYQDGKAQYKHKIFEYKSGSGNWYIVRCDEHQVHFGYNNPVHGAAKHVHSPQHGNLEKRHDLAIGICGHRITGCNAELAEINNREFERALKQDGYVVFNMNLLTKEGRRRLTDGVEIHVNGDSPAKKKLAKLQIKPEEDVSIAQPCRFYQGLWSPNKKWYMLIMLPIRSDGSLREVGLKQTLQETDLMGTVPKCYRVDRNSLQIKGWQAAYDDGGPKVSKREYPVMFFDGYQKHSLGWLPASKLRPVDLDNPPDGVDRRGLMTAREWFAQQMMYRKDWEEFKKLGPGQPRSSTGSDEEMDKNDQVPSLRSAHTDDQSPIRDKSSKPEGFPASSSDEASDDEDPMSMDMGPVPEATDSNYANDSDSETSDVEMEDARQAEENETDRPRRRSSTASESRTRPFSRSNNRRAAAEEDTTEPKKDGTQPERPRSSRTTQFYEKRTEEVEPEEGRPTTGQSRGVAEALVAHEYLIKSAQAKAAAAVKEAASRSRASSEVPETIPRNHTQSAHHDGLETPTRPEILSRPKGAEHHRSRSEDNFATNGGAPLASYGMHKLNEVRKPSDLHSILNQDQTPTGTTGSSENHADPYKRAEAIKAQMDGLMSRSASAPVHEGNDAPSPFPPPPLQPAPSREVLKSGPQQSPSLSHILSPPMQSPMMIPPRSSSSTPVQGIESGRSTPKILIPNNSDKWQTLRNASGSSQQSQTPRASFVNTPSTTPQSGTSEATTKTASQVFTPGQLVKPTPQLGTPITEREAFDVSQFRDSARGVRWSREGPEKPYLRLNTDPMRGWAETASSSPLTAAVEPSKVVRIEVDSPDGDSERQRVQLVLRDGSQQVLVFETNSANQRPVKAAVQRRRFITWLRKLNGTAEYRNCSDDNRRPSLVMDDRRSVTAE